MESLVANYASSDEEEDKRQEGTSFPSKAISPFSSLPQPKSSSLFSSLPRPQKNLVTKTPIEENEPKHPTPNPNKSSIFSALPQPTSQTQQQPAKPTKRVVRFVPPSIKSNNFDDEDEEDEEKEKQRKKRKESEYLDQGSSVKSFLLNIPAPKSSATLGVRNSSQGGSGRRSIIETEASASSSSDLGTKNESSNVQNAVNYQSYDQNSVDYTNYDQSAEAQTSYEGGNDQNVENFTNYTSYQTGVDDQNVGNFTNYASYETVIDENVSRNYVDYGYGDYGQYGSATTVPMTGARVPGKRGKNEIPTEIVEVKQDELMKDRPREDQVKLTGIAFGPSYQPVSTKGKPSKLHKRKHQIGSLYFDMKQKETELAERRSRGLLTKSQTQGKYGW